MGFEIWIVVLLAASGLSGWAGFAYARRRAPRQSEVDALNAELEAARQEAEAMQANVNVHFEEGARLFGKLASDYREFLEHFAGSAQALGLSEARARELIEQGSQPLLTHDEAAGEVVATEPIASEPVLEAEEEPGEAAVGRAAVREVEMPAEMDTEAAVAKEAEPVTGQTGEAAPERETPEPSSQTDTEPRRSASP